MTNPYVGPRAFKEGQTLYGRGDDSSRLFHLLLADRIVLLYSPSGAGKTSLLEAQLTKRLREEDFHVIYDIRTHREPAREPGTLPAAGTNRYVLSAILSLENSVPEPQRLTLAELEAIALPDYLARLEALQDREGVRIALLFDQFEEIFRVDETDIEAKREFFTVLGKALEDRSFYAVFAMREDSIALLDDYSHLIPYRLKARQRLSLLTREQAVEAIRRPAQDQGVDFQAAEALVQDLSRVTTMLSDGSTRVDYGPHVEPVQLQVVCYTVWEKPRSNPLIIDDLTGVSVDTALADYYNTCIAEVLRNQPSTTEREVRDWFSRSLITPRGVRTQVLLGIERTEGLLNTDIAVLVHRYIVRREERGGRTWFELAHDRLVNPIRTSNETWSSRYLTPLQIRAERWSARNQDPQLFLVGRELVEAIRLMEKDAAHLTEIESAFVTRSRAALSDIERAAVEWELAGQPREKLLRGAELDAALKVARTKGEYHLTPEAKALLAESTGARNTRRWTYQLGIYTAILIGVVVYTLYQRSEQTREILSAVKVGSYSSHEKPVTDEAAREWIAAQSKIEDLSDSRSSSWIWPRTPVPRDSRPVLQYSGARGDGPKLRAGLAELEFRIVDRAAATTAPSNCIWYGQAVAADDVKLVAYALIRSGGKLQSIEPLPGHRENVVRVGYNGRVAKATPLLTDDVDQMKLDDQTARAPAPEDETSGTVKSYDPTTRQGILISGGDAIRFRVPFGRLDVRSGDTVRFALLPNSEEQSAMILEVLRRQASPLRGTDARGN